MRTLKLAIEKDDASAITPALEGLTAAMQGVSQKLYAQTAQEQAGGGSTTGGDGASTAPPPGTNGSDDQVIDAEVVDDQKS